MPENPQRAGAVLIDGKGIADETIAKLGRAVATLEVPPLLVVVMVGKQAPSLSYIKRKEAAAAECGIRTRLLQMDEDTEQAALLQAIASLNDDEDVDGIIVQLPLPPASFVGRFVARQQEVVPDQETLSAPQPSGEDKPRALRDEITKRR